LTSPKIAILVVAYNAEDTLHHVLDRIPTEFAQRVSVVLVCDDASTDSTHSQALKYLQGSKLPLNIVRHAANLGYGGNQKFGYRWAIDNGVDIVVLLHGDGQYAPEELSRMVQPIVDNNADVVFGSRMIHRSKALKGGMPLYKFVGNIFLTSTQNLLTGVRLSEWHTGYRAYRVSSLQGVSFDWFTPTNYRNTNPHVLWRRNLACQHHQIWSANTWAYHQVRPETTPQICVKV
jgi:glycosyltransferase involved in cell wall biosynthesis